MIKKIDIEKLKAKISYEELYDLYITQNKSLSQILKDLKISRKLLYKLLKIYNIKTRREYNNYNSLASNISKSELKRLYIKENKSKVEIAKLLGVSKRRITNILYNLHIVKKKDDVIKNLNYIAKNQTNKYKEKLKDLINKVSKEDLIDMFINKRMTRAELIRYLNISRQLFTDLLKYYNLNKNIYLKNKRPSKELLKKLYIKEGKTIKEIAKITGYSNTIIQSLIKQYNLVLTNTQLQDKRIKTMHKNKSWNRSKEEDYIYFLLKSKFYKVKRQYNSELYPFACDFYIPSLNLYIEYQGSWTHEKEAYDNNNIDHLIIVNKWKQKIKTGHDYYKNAIDVWTVRDPLKRETAKKNGLNWIEFFNLDEFLSWFRAQSGTPLLVYSPL